MTDETRQSPAETVSHATAEWRVVARPRLKREYPGRTVRTLHRLDTSIASVPAGTIARIEARPNIGTVIKTAPCACCGVAVRVARLHDDDFEFVEQLTKSQQPAAPSEAEATRQPLTKEQAEDLTRRST